MSIRIIALSGLVAGAIGAILFSQFWSPRESAVEAQIEKLVRQYDNEIFLNFDYKAAKRVADEIVSLASKSDDPQGTEVRGLVRLAYLEIAFGKWGNSWRKKIKKCEMLVSENPTIDRGEFLLYWGFIKGKWQGEFDEGIERIQEAIWISNHVKDDRTLALAYMSQSELYGFKKKPSLVARNSYQGVAVASHYDQKSMKVRTLGKLINDLIYLDKYSEAADRADELILLLPDSSDAMFAQFLARKSNRYAEYVDGKLKGLISREEKGHSPTKRECSILGTSLQRLATGFVHRKEFENCRKYAELAIPYLEIANNKSSMEGCSLLLRIAGLAEADTVGKVDAIAKMFDEKAKFKDDAFMEALAVSYAKVGAVEKSLYWRELAIDSCQSRLAAEVGYLKESANSYWDSELRTRKQAEISSTTAAKANRRIWLLSMALLFGFMVCTLLGVLYAALNRERNLLEETVKTRTMTLSKAMQEASAADRAKSDFLAQINHEIRNPLTAILGYCDLLSTVKGKSHEFVAGIESSSLHLRELVDKILEVSKIETCGLELKTDEFLPEQTAAGINDILAEQATKHGLKFKCIFKGDHKFSILSDETKIRQIALNLIGNSIKFTVTGSVVAIFELREHDDLSAAQLNIVVKDTGIGIAESEKSTIFERFVKASNGTGIDGSGLGLFITNQLVDCLGGELSLESELGVGTKVTVSLPVNIIKHSQTKSESTNDSPVEAGTALGYSGKRILVVDDQEMIRTTLKLQLKAYGLQCKATQQLEKTIELVENWRPDLVLLDLRMPRHSGFEVFDRIRQSKNSGVLVYAITGDATPQVQEKCLNAGFEGFITKPFQIRTILEILGAEKSEIF